MNLLLLNALTQKTASYFIKNSIVSSTTNLMWKSDATNKKILSTVYSLLAWMQCQG